MKGMLAKKREESNRKESFLEATIKLFLSIMGRINFLSLERYGKLNEKSYRNNFENGFDFLKYNKKMIKERELKNPIIVGDASFIRKSGKKTPGLDIFWSGKDSLAKKGLEIHTLAVVDTKTKEAYHLQTQQTVLPTEIYYDKKFDLTKEEIGTKKKKIGKKNSEPLRRTELYTKNPMYSYLKQIILNSKELLEISKYFVYDAFAYKKDFLDPIIEAGFEVISKARKDANLRYLYTGKQKEGRGRKKRYDGKIDWKIPELNRFTKEEYMEKDVEVHSIIANAQHLKRDLKLAYIINKKTSKSIILYSTDLKLSAQEIIEGYKARFQIEFLFRDAKQFTGLEDCQSRSLEKLNYHFNTSLTAVSVAKFDFYQKGENLDKPFSMHNIKVANYNNLVADFIFSNSEIPQSSNLITKIHDQLSHFGHIYGIKDDKICEL